jgi:AcrR family transcriptional regulator
VRLVPASRQKESPPEGPSSRERVLAGATEEFAQYGFAGARIDRIAQRVGLNVRMIYYHFGNKEGLYHGVLRDIYSSAADLLDRVIQESDPERRRVEVLAGYFDLVTTHAHFADIMVREYLDGGVHLKKLFAEDPSIYERIHKRANEIVDGLVGSGAIRKVPGADTVFMISASAAFIWASREVQPLFLGGRKPTGPEWKAKFLDLVFNGLKASS